MSEVQKDLQDVSAGTGQFKKIWQIRILSWNWRQSQRGQLWPRPVELGLTGRKLTSPGIGQICNRALRFCARESSTCREGYWRVTTAARSHFEFWKASCAVAVHSNVRAPPSRDRLKGATPVRNFARNGGKSSPCPENATVAWCPDGGRGFDCRGMTNHGGRSCFQNHEAKNFQGGDCKNAFLKVDGETFGSQRVEKSFQMKKVCLPVWRTHTRVIYVCKHTLKTVNCAVHHALKSLCSVRQSNWSEQILEQAKWHDTAIFGMSVAATLDKINFRKTLQPCRPLEKSCMFGKGYLSGVWPNWEGKNRHKPTMIHLFWAPCAKGRPMVILNGEQCKWIPNFWIPFLQSQVLLDQGDGILQRLVDGYSCELNVMFHSMGWGGHHITRAQDRGEFLKQTLHVCRHRIRNLQHWSGFGCPWNKKGGSEICKKIGKKGLAAVRGGAEQANRIWLVSGATVILNFLKKSMLRMGPATAAC